MVTVESLIKYIICILMSLLLFLIGIHEYALAVGGKEAISTGCNIRELFDPVGTHIIINGKMSLNNILGGPLTASRGSVKLPGMKSPANSITGAGGMYNIIPGPASGNIMLPDMSPVMGEIPLSLSGGMPLIANMMVSAIIGPLLMNPLMVKPNPMNLPIVWPGPMCPFSIAYELIRPSIMYPCTMCPLMSGPGSINSMIMPALINSFKIGPYLINTTMLDGFLPYIANTANINPSANTQINPPLDQEEQYSEDCISKTIYKEVKKGNIVFLEVYDGCTGKIYRGYPSGIWLPIALETSPQSIADYSWWYGCSVTCAGMMMAYYDRHPYYVNGNIYDLIPGGIAEYESFLNPDPWYLTDPSNNDLVRLCNRAIASKNHALDFWTIPTNPSSSFGLIGDPLDSIRKGDPAGFDCLADFMGTSQNGLSGSRGNPDGITWFWFPSDGTILSSDSVSWPSWYDPNYSGMYGLVEWAHYCQTISGQIMNPYAFNQYIEGYTPPAGQPPSTGFSFSDYKAEIVNGRPVMFLLVDWDLDAGHSVLGVGYGYNSVTGQGEVYIHDTFTKNDPEDPKKIPWVNSEFSYSVTVSGTIRTYNFEMMGVTVFHPDKP